MRAVLSLGLSFLALAIGCGGEKANQPDAPTAPGDDGGSILTDAADSIDAAGTPVDAGITCKSGTTVALAPVASGLDEPLLVTFAPGDPRLFVIEKAGRIRVIEDGQLLPTPLLDLSGTSGPIQGGSERGLLGLAFHPGFATNDRFYVHYSAKPSGDHVVAEYRATHGTDTAEASTFRQVLRFTDPFSNHNGGAIEFGPDGKLYIAIGDGGSGGDPQDRAQNDTQLFGKLLRIDVDTRTGSKAYGIPSDNPFASSADGAADPRPEIWQKGLRNPFRFTFDRGTGNLYIGDVGQGPNPVNLEEIDVGPNVAGTNWGWDDREANRCYEPSTGCLTASRVEPAVVHSGSQGWLSIMGGQVYRGTCFPGLVGTYFYGDHFTRDLWAFEYADGAAQNDREVLPNIGAITAVHEDAAGELYVVTLDGQVRRIVVP